MVVYSDKLNGIAPLVVKDVDEWGVCDEVFGDSVHSCAKLEGCGGCGLGTFFVHSHLGFVCGFGDTEVSCVYK